MIVLAFALEPYELGEFRIDMASLSLKLELFCLYSLSLRVLILLCPDLTNIY